MPLIWDDYQYLFIDEEDVYDKTRFVVVRKLFISLNPSTKDCDQMTRTLIERNFRKFGKIESVEMLCTNDQEAYITFDCDRAAYLALAHSELHGRQSDRTFNIQPADTWEQPDCVEMSADEAMEDSLPPMFMLNEDCILNIFKYLDFDSLVNLSNVCKLFRNLLNQHVFPRYRELSIPNGFTEIQMPLAKMRRYLKCIGPHISELTFKWHDFDKNHRLKRFLEKLGQYVGNNIRRIRFRDTVLTEDNIQAIENILSNVEQLEIIVYNPQFDLDLDFVRLCPKLEKFKLLENMQLIKCCRQWQSLHHLSIVGNEYMVLNTFKSFIRLNPQLRCLKFTAYHADERLQAIAQYLPNLEKLTILPSFPDLTGTNIAYLSGLQHLTQLNLMYLDEHDIDGIILSLIRFKALRVLKLHLLFDGFEDDDHFEPNQEHMLKLSQELPHLEQLNTRYIRWRESTLIDFIRAADQLKIMHLHWSDLPITHSLIWKIVKSHPQPLNLFVNPSDLNTIDNKQILCDQDLVRNVKISSKCRHAGDSV